VTEHERLKDEVILAARMVLEADKNDDPTLADVDRIADLDESLSTLEDALDALDAYEQQKNGH
jgi:hypothetical protein